MSIVNDTLLRYQQDLSLETNQAALFRLARGGFTIQIMRQRFDKSPVNGNGIRRNTRKLENGSIMIAENDALSTQIKNRRTDEF